MLDGNLMESRVRSQMSISSSSGEAEFASMVAGCSDGLLVWRIWMKLVGEEREMKPGLTAQQPGPWPRGRESEGSGIWTLPSFGLDPAERDFSFTDIGAVWPTLRLYMFGEQCQ